MMTKTTVRVQMNASKKEENKNEHERREGGRKEGRFEDDSKLPDRHEAHGT